MVAAERARLVAIAGLNQAIGINVSAPTEVVDRTDEPPFGLTLAESLQQAVDNRCEFQVARRSIEQAAEGERVAKAEFAPRVYFEGVAATEGAVRSWAVAVGPGAAVAPGFAVIGGLDKSMDCQPAGALRSRAS